MFHGKKPWISEVEYQYLHDFRDIAAKTFKVVDHIKIKNMGKHSLTLLTSKEKFVREVHFYRNRRVQMAQAISFLTLKQLNDEDYSGVYSRLKVKKMIKDAGIRGRKRGIEKRQGFVQGQRFIPPTAEFEKREIFKLDENKEYYPESKHPYIIRLLDLIDDARKSTKQQELPPSWNNPGGDTTI